MPPSRHTGPADPSSVARARAALRPLAPVPAGVAPRAADFSGMRAVVFDIYGTLLISAAGDPGGVPPGAAREGARAAAARLGGRTARTPPGRLDEAFRALVSDHQERRRAEGVAHPEIDVRAVWSELAQSCGDPPPGGAALAEAALLQECAVNPVWPMPGALDLVKSLAAAGRRLGILSNAQCSTAAVFEAAAGAGFDRLGFDPELRVLSFEQLEAKPSPRLFGILRERLEAAGVDPGETLCIGNDIEKDVRPARAAGFRTALFAGDRRSLRLGPGGASALALPDAVATRFAELGEMLLPGGAEPPAAPGEPS